MDKGEGDRDKGEDCSALPTKMVGCIRL